MIGGSDACELPRQGAWLGMRAVFPPAGPKPAQPFMGIGRRGVGEVGREKSGESKKITRTVEGREMAHLGEGSALGEEGHRELVLMVAQRVSESLPEGLRVAMNVAHTVKAFRFMVCAVKSCFF